MKTTLFIALAGVAGMTLLAGCETQSKAKPGTEPLYMGLRVPESDAGMKPAPAKVEEKPAAAPRATPTVAATGNNEVTELAYPTGEKATSAILLRQTAPREIRANSEYEYTIDVINLTRGNLQNVVVNADNLSNLTYVSSTPAFTKAADGDTMWAIGDLGGGEMRTIKIKAKADKVGTASNCLSVSYANVLCVATNVVEPALQLVKTATPELCGTCDEVRLTYEVKNTGTGAADNVVIKDTLPAGMTVNGKNTVELAAGTLAAGQSRPFTVMAKVDKAGEFKSGAQATATGGLMAASGVPVTVVKTPQLTVTCEAPGRVFVGRDINYRFTVKNGGTCAASDSVVSVPLPAGATFVSADNNGRLEGNRVVWNLGSVAAGGTSTLNLRVKPTGMGSTPVVATATATCVPAATTNCATEVAGIPAILLEVVDTDDPVEVGGQTTFIVTATNQGSAADTNVRVTATLPEGMEFVSGTGASAVTANGRTITMAPVPTLASRARAEWRVVVRAKGEGDVRSKWDLTSDQFKTPITETESTNLYK
jgi:uncharacterized repeat protein (TIGR01451 family)